MPHSGTLQFPPETADQEEVRHGTPNVACRKRHVSVPSGNRPIRVAGRKRHVSVPFGNCPIREVQRTAPIVARVSVVALIVALVVTFVAASIQGVVGMGFAMVSVPILALIDPTLAPVPQLLITMPLTIMMAWRERRHIDVSGVGWIVAGRIPGVIIGVTLLAVATQVTLDVTIAVIVLMAVAIVASGYHVRRTPVTEFGAGTLAGVTGLVASIGGPPLALLYTSDDGPIRRSNLAVVFTIGLSITLTARLVTGNISWHDVQVALILFPALILGYLASLLFKNRVPQRFARATILILSIAGSLGLLVRAVV